MTAPTPGADLATVAPSTGALALRSDQHEWNPEQHAALAQIGVADAPPGDQAVFLHVCQRTGLDPFARQIYMIARKERGWGSEPDKVKWTIQTGIDGFRLIAERHPQYAGTLDPEWCGDDGIWTSIWVARQPPVAARVRVLRRDRLHPITLPVRFIEFAPTNRDGSYQGQWRVKPAHMIAKVAEVASLRKAFPLDMSGMYAPEEMDHDDTAQFHSPAAAIAGDVPAVTVRELTGGRTAAAPPTVTPPEGEPPPPASPSEVRRQREEMYAAAGLLVPPPPDPGPDADEGPTNDEPRAPSARLRRLHALIRDAQVIRRDDRLELAGFLVGRTISSFDDVRVSDVDRAISALEQLQDSTDYPAAVAHYVVEQRRRELGDGPPGPSPFAEDDPRDEDPTPAPDQTGD